MLSDYEQCWLLPVFRWHLLLPTRSPPFSPRTKTNISCMVWLRPGLAILLVTGWLKQLTLLRYFHGSSPIATWHSISPEYYYLFYALLLGIYVWCLLEIVSSVWELHHPPSRWLAFVAVIIVIYSAGFRFTLSRLLGANWAYILEDGVADQRLLGSVFEPSTFGVLLLLSILLFLRNHSLWAVVPAIIAATVHPTYLLSSAVLVFAYCVITLFNPGPVKGRIISTIEIAALSCLLISPILAYTWSNFGLLSGAEAERARQILASYRIPHHTLITTWFDATAVVKIVLIIVGLLLARKSRLFLLLLILSLIAAGLTLFQFLSNNLSLALLFPWRISTLLLPISTAIIAGKLVIAMTSSPRLQDERPQKIIIAISCGLIVLAVLTGLTRLFLDFQRKNQSPEHGLYTYISINHSRNDVYLTPIKMQDFRLVTNMPVFVDFKSIPYRSEEVIQWYRRIQEADKFYSTPNCKRLQQIVETGQITQVIMPRSERDLDCPGLVESYMDGNYRLYSFVPDALDTHPPQ